jgi:urea carboxylase
MFDKVLIANRGAIACRVIRTLKKLGIQSVAVYSEADRDSLHVTLADEAIYIGDAPASQSYLNVDKILEVAKQTGANAIHPGYGFLSENADFCDLCESQGIAFIGPNSAQMRAFGLKHTARELAIEANVPLLPGSQLLADEAEALVEAERIGYPVMLKSTAGGGGIGMRLVWNAEELKDAFATVSYLAQANFKDAGLYLEKFVQNARHIEVQIFGDGQGKVLALGERDCSVQRRNQKVIEETPAPHLNDQQRSYIQTVAIQLMQSVNYRSAGTVEFVMDTDTQDFYFLEVNTRLQVEHGVTEQVYGVDLVEWMVTLASGDWTAPTQSLKSVGHSIQVRLYAEDPIKNFQPSAGLLTFVEFDDQARNETWVETGSTVSSFYDPMIAKIIVTANDRDAAIQAMNHSLAKTQVAGIETNLEYLLNIIDCEVFKAGTQTTRFLNTFEWKTQKIEVLQAGIQTSIQDVTGRLGYWDVGVPPSGAIDPLSLNVANQLLGNASNSAGVALASTVEGMSYEEMEWVFDINFWGVVHGTKAFLPYLKQSGEGHIINISSLFGLTAQPTQSAYNATKFAVRGFTESLRQELDLQANGVSATCVHPGGIRTNIANSARMSDSIRALGLNPAKASKAFNKVLKTPPEEAAKVILNAVKKDQRRVLIGNDAKILDLIQRVAPSHYAQALNLFTKKKK